MHPHGGTLCGLWLMQCLSSSPALGRPHDAASLLRFPLSLHVGLLRNNGAQRCLGFHVPCIRVIRVLVWRPPPAQRPSAEATTEYTPERRGRNLQKSVAIPEMVIAVLKLKFPVYTEQRKYSFSLGVLPSFLFFLISDSGSFTANGSPVHTSSLLFFSSPAAGVCALSE